MKKLERDELYQNVQEFLKNKGVELKDGSYSQKIQKSCSLLSDVINKSQQGVALAKVEIDKKLDQLRQVIHEKTAPGAGRAAPRSEPVPPRPQAAATKPANARKQAGKKSGPRRSTKRARPNS